MIVVGFVIGFAAGMLVGFDRVRNAFEYVVDYVRAWRS